MKKDSPDLMGSLGKRRPGRPRKRPTPTAAQIADDMEKRAKEMLHYVDLLRGKSK